MTGVNDMIIYHTGRKMFYESIYTFVNTAAAQLEQFHTDLKEMKIPDISYPEHYVPVTIFGSRIEELAKRFHLVCPMDYFEFRQFGEWHLERFLRICLYGTSHENTRYDEPSYRDYPNKSVEEKAKMQVEVLESFDHFKHDQWMKDLIKNITDSATAGKLVYNDFVNLGIHLQIIFFTAQFHLHGPPRIVQLIREQSPESFLLTEYLDEESGYHQFISEVHMCETVTRDEYRIELRYMIANFIKYCCPAPDSEWGNHSVISKFIRYQRNLIRLDDRYLDGANKSDIVRCTALALSWYAIILDLRPENYLYHSECKLDPKGKPYKTQQEYEKYIEDFESWIRSIGWETLKWRTSQRDGANVVHEVDFVKLFQRKQVEETAELAAVAPVLKLNQGQKLDMSDVAVLNRLKDQMIHLVQKSRLHAVKTKQPQLYQAMDAVYHDAHDAFQKTFKKRQT